MTASRQLPGGQPQWRPTWRREFFAEDLACPLFVEGGVSVQHESLHLQPHAHPGWEFHVIASGTMVTELDDGSLLRASGGDLVITEPGIWHRGENNAIAPSKLLWLVLGPLDPKDLGGSSLLPGDVARLERTLRNTGNAVVRAPGLVAHLHAITRILKQGPITPDLARAARLRAACSALLLDAADVLGAGKQPQASAVTLAARAWLADNLSQPILVPELARRHNLSPSRFHEVFLAETGETPAACHLRLRLAAAAVAMRDSAALPVGVVAERLGFSDQRYFATCFKRQTGMTPSQFRRIAYRGSPD